MLIRIRTGGILVLLATTSLLMACGGGGGGVRDRGPVTPPMDPVTPPMDSSTYSNTNAFDPLPSFRAAPLPTSGRFAYQREVPSGTPAIALITPYIAPGTNPPDDLIPMLRRGIKLWTRRIDGVRVPGGLHPSVHHAELSTDGQFELDFVIGYEQPRCLREACANHYGDHLLEPSGRTNAGENPHVSVMPAFLTNNVRNGQLTIGGFRILTHEFGHVLDHGDEQNTGESHSDCTGGAIMCSLWESNVPAVPVDRDFDGIRHHYDVRTDTDHELFGIWADVPGEDSDLTRFGVRVTRTLTVTDATDLLDPAASDFIHDQILIETVVSDCQKTPTFARNLRRTTTHSARFGPRNPPHRHH